VFVVALEHTITL